MKFALSVLSRSAGGPPQPARSIPDDTIRISETPDIETVATRAREAERDRVSTRSRKTREGCARGTSFRRRDDGERPIGAPHPRKEAAVAWLHANADPEASG